MSFLNSTSTQKSTILITGGASGIGLALSVRFLDLGHTVIVAGRRQEQLDEALGLYPKLNAVLGDIGSDAGRIALFQKVIKDFPDVNVLFNNAAVGDFGVGLLKDIDNAGWTTQKNVIESNLNATIHLSILFTPHFITKSHALISNVTSVVAFVPVSIAVVYSASKAAIHSFTISLRHQLKDTSVKVVEIVPPAVDTEAARRIGSPPGGLNVDTYADDTIAQLLADKSEISYNDMFIRDSRDQLDNWFKVFNGVVA